jgi:hypothetical protein
MFHRFPPSASGYYEWKNEAGGKEPYYFTRADGGRCEAALRMIGYERDLGVDYGSD